MVTVVADATRGLRRGVRVSTVLLSTGLRPGH